MKLFRKYTGVNGTPRLLEFVEDKSYFVEFAKKIKDPMLLGVKATNTLNKLAVGRAQIWKMENGHIIQIPDTAWKYCGIKYQDEWIDI